MQGSGHLVIRNTFYLTAAQALTVPLSVLLNAVAAHYLGAETFGYAYLAATLCGFGFLVVSWGQEAVLPAEVAKDHSVAGRLLGTSLLWRVVVSLLVYLALASICLVLRYPREVQWALALTAVFFAFNYFVAAVKDTIRGLERTDIPAYAHVAQQALATALACGVLVAGGKLRALLLAQAIAGAIVLAVLWRVLARVGVGRLFVTGATVKALAGAGTPFMLLGLAMALQPNVDVIFLSKLSPPEVLGWLAVTRRLLGALLLPATALIGALYPTLCRLHATDQGGFARTTNGALRSVSLLIAPIALGCLFFPQLGVALFSRQMFRPAEDNLRIMSAFIALVYLSMPIGIAIMAAGKQRAWSVVQCLSVAISFVLDPLLIPFFQRRYANGGLGVSLASVISEVCMVGLGIVLIPKGVFDARLRRVLVGVTVSGAGFAAVAWLMRGVNPLLAAAAACGAYGLGLWLTGAIDAQQLGVISRALGRRAELGADPVEPTLL